MVLLMLLTMGLCLCCFSFVVINAERASYSAPGFCGAIERIREELMQAIVDTYLHND
jgi:hypothetical protein